MIRKRSKHYSTRDGQLYRVFCCGKNKPEECLCLVLEIRKEEDKHLSVVPAGNHEEKDRTQAKIREKYYWPGVTKDVKYWVGLFA